MKVPSYSKFLELLGKTGETAYQVCKDTGIDASSFTKWKTGEYAPKIGKLYLLAQHFGVSVEELLEDKDDN